MFEKKPLAFVSIIDSLSSFGRQSVLSLNRSHFAPVQL